jgi:hypothetical protein
MVVKETEGIIDENMQIPYPITVHEGFVICNTNRHIRIKGFVQCQLNVTLSVTIRLEGSDTAISIAGTRRTVAKVVDDLMIVVIFRSACPNIRERNALMDVLDVGA